jgi:hypothetical protein
MQVWVFAGNGDSSSKRRRERIFDKEWGGESGVKYEQVGRYCNKHTELYM